MPAALITVVDADSTWFKSNIGFGDATRTTRNRSLCDQVVRTNEMLIVEDLTKDPRFANNPFVTAKPHMRFCTAQHIHSKRVRGEAVSAIRGQITDFFFSLFCFSCCRCWRSAD